MQIRYSFIFEIQLYAALGSLELVMCTKLALNLGYSCFCFQSPGVYRCVSPCLTKREGFTAYYVSGLLSRYPHNRDQDA